MSSNPDEHWQCQACSQQFPSHEELRQHIRVFQSRLQYLVSRVQVLVAEIQICSAHSCSELSDERDCEAFTSSSSSASAFASSGGEGECDDVNILDGDEHKELLCPHKECDNKSKTSFKRWKNLARHYTIHFQCHETCEFCGLDFHRVAKYATHLDSCKARKEGERSDEFVRRERKALERRRILRNDTSTELLLKRSMIAANTSDDTAPSKETSSRKRARERADTDTSSHRRQKQQIADRGGTNTTVAIILNSSHKAPGPEDVSEEIATPTHFGMSSNGALNPIHDIDTDESIALSTVVPYTHDAHIIADYMEISAGALPYLAMNGSSSSFEQEYESTLQIKAPLLDVYTMDGSASYPMDGSSSRQPVCLEAQASMAIYTAYGQNLGSGGYEERWS